MRRKNMKQITKTTTELYFDEASKEQFKQWLYNNHLTMGEVADKLDISWTYLSFIINGKRPITRALQEKFRRIGYEM
jgi:predicted transcriptional regulator